MITELRMREVNESTPIPESKFWIFEKGYDHHENLLKKVMKSPALLNKYPYTSRVVNLLPGQSYSPGYNCYILYFTNIHPTMGEEAP